MSDEQKRNDKNNKVSLIVPIYSEEIHLEKFLKLIDEIQFSCTKELIFVDDKSKDSSLIILKKFNFKSEHKIIEQPCNQGKGAALRIGIQNATGNIIGIQDADFEYSLKDVHSILELFLTDEADVVFGSRFKKTVLQVHRTFHYIVNRILTWMSNLLSGLYLTDMETCYKFFKADIIKNINLESNRFGFEPEITAKIARLRLRICEVPISYHPRNYLEGKKITWKDGVAAIRHILYFNMLKSKSSFFKETLPSEYIPKDRNLL